MNVRTFYKIDELVRAAEELADEMDVLTIDLFDTLVVRRMADPDALKVPVARFIADLAKDAGLNFAWQTVLRLRAEIEQAHRAANGLLHPDQEACYPDFMGELLRNIFSQKYSEHLLQQVTDWELKLESAVIVPRAAMLDLVSRWHAAGKKVWVMTDIYLPGPLIRVLLDRAGLLPHLTGVVSSADDCQAKASGAGFKRIAEREQFDAQRWLHIGDNPISDGMRPAEQGIRALVLRDASEAHRKSIFRQYEKTAQARPFWRGRLVQQIMLPLEAENQEHTPLYADGHEFFGVLIGGFIKYIAERSRELGLQRLYFFSREGGTFHKAWQQAVPWLYPRGGAPQTSYLYVSRMALTAASCARRGLPIKEAAVALLPGNNKDIRDVFRVFGLDLNTLRFFLERHGLAEDAALKAFFPNWHPENWRKFELLLADADFQAAVREQTSERGRLVESYLEQEDFFEHPAVGLIDVGWLGSIQHFLHATIEHRHDKPHMHGLLFGATRAVDYPVSSDNTKEGFIYDRARSMHAGQAITFGLDVFEEAFRAPHAGVIGYSKDEDVVKPVFMPNDAPERIKELEQDKYYSALQQAAADASSRFAAAMAVLGFSSAEIRPWLEYLLFARMAFPRSSEMRRLQFKYHVDQFQGMRRVPWSIRLCQLSIWDLPHCMAGIPGFRTFFYLWTLKGQHLLAGVLGMARASIHKSMDDFWFTNPK